jgi:hypothetical protein
MLIIAVVAYGLWQYSQPNQELLDAKKELWIQVDNTLDSKIIDAKKEVFEQVDNAIDTVKEVVQEVVVEKPTFTTKLLNWNDILELNDLSNIDLSSWEVDLVWKIKAPVDKIRVLYSNSDSDYPDDDYSLQQFVAGSENFLYRAYSQYQTFDFWTNTYTIIMTSWKEESRLQFTIYYPNPEDNKEIKSDDWIEIISDIQEIDSSALPTSWDYWSPIKLWENKFTYSDIKGFQVEKHSVSTVDCSSDLVTSTIWEKTWSWSWWNTCRPSEDKTYVTYYALNMKDWEYVYAKHYFSPSYYAITELSTGVDEWWNSLETVSDKNEWLKNNNNELKEQNESFELTKITDTLFENIIKN